MPYVLFTWGKPGRFFPKLDYDQNLITFSVIAERFLENLGYEPVHCSSEEEARKKVRELKTQKKYPVFFFKSDTTGEKDFEEFYTSKELLDMDRFRELGIIKNKPEYDEQKLDYFTDTIQSFRKRGFWSRSELINLFIFMMPEFQHKETGKFLDSKM
jgi:hypothetical protein